LFLNGAGFVFSKGIGSGLVIDRTELFSMTSCVVSSKEIRSDLVIGRTELFNMTSYVVFSNGIGSDLVIGRTEQFNITSFIVFSNRIGSDLVIGKTKLFSMTSFVARGAFDVINLLSTEYVFAGIEKADLMGGEYCTGGLSGNEDGGTGGGVYCGGLPKVSFSLKIAGIRFETGTGWLLYLLILNCSW